MTCRDAPPPGRGCLASWAPRAAQVCRAAWPPPGGTGEERFRNNSAAGLREPHPGPSARRSGSARLTPWSGADAHHGLEGDQHFAGHAGRQGTRGVEATGTDTSAINLLPVTAYSTDGDCDGWPGPGPPACPSAAPAPPRTRPQGAQCHLTVPSVSGWVGGWVEEEGATRKAPRGRAEGTAMRWQRPQPLLPWGPRAHGEGDAREGAPCQGKFQKQGCSCPEDEESADTACCPRSGLTEGLASSGTCPWLCGRSQPRLGGQAPGVGPSRGRAAGPGRPEPGPRDHRPEGYGHRRERDRLKENLELLETRGTAGAGGASVRGHGSQCDTATEGSGTGRGAGAAEALGEQLSGALSPGAVDRSEKTAAQPVRGGGEEGVGGRTGGRGAVGLSEQTPPSRDVDEVPQVLVHALQLAVVDGVGGVDQRRPLLVHFADVEVLGTRSVTLAPGRLEPTVW